MTYTVIETPKSIPDYRPDMAGEDAKNYGCTNHGRILRTDDKEIQPVLFNKDGQQLIVFYVNSIYMLDPKPHKECLVVDKAPVRFSSIETGTALIEAVGL